MKRVSIVLGLLFSFDGVLFAQTNRTPGQAPLAETQASEISTVLQEPVPLNRRPVLPDNPIPVMPNIQDGPFPCPAGVGKPCALLGGRLYFRDPSHMTEHDATLAEALRNPLMLVGETFNLAATIADIEGTQACLRVHTCSEGNPMFGSKPSRAESYGIGIPMNLATYVLTGYMKEKGQGNLAFALLWSGTVLHTYEAAHGWGLASTGTATSTKSSGGLKFGMVIKF